MLRLYVILTCQDVAKQWIVAWRDTVVIQKHLMTFSLLIDVPFGDGQGCAIPLILLQHVLIHFDPCKRHFSSSFPPLCDFLYVSSIKFISLSFHIYFITSHLIWAYN